jgi:hypothetical protein
MTALWKDVRCACIPVDGLPYLAEMRGRAEIRVRFAGDRAWVWWEPDSPLQEEIVVRRILPLRTAELFTERCGHWYRLGARLPAFGVSEGDESAGVLLERVVLPAPIDAAPPPAALPDPMPVRLVRDERGSARPASAFRCALGELLRWAEGTTSAQLARLQAAWTGAHRGAQRDPSAAADVLVLGNPGPLPFLSDSVRFWGTDLLVPLGFRADPDLPETALLGALGARSGELAVMEADGFELIARGVFKRLSLAGIRLAREQFQSAGPADGSPR